MGVDKIIGKIIGKIIKFKHWHPHEIIEGIVKNHCVTSNYQLNRTNVYDVCKLNGSATFKVEEQFIIK